MKKIILLVLTLSITLVLCELDPTEPGLEPTRSGFKGRITFKGAWPEDTDQIIVAAALKFPPSALNDVILGEGLPTGQDTVDYTFYLPPTSLMAVGVVWKQKGQEWDPTNIIGYYFPTANHLSPGKLEIPDRDTMIETIDITADLSKAKRKVACTIEGTLRAQGIWPANSQSVVMVASTAPVLPTSLLDLLFAVPISPGFESTPYKISVQPGTYHLIAALLIREGESIGLNSMAGSYYSLGGISVPTDSTHVRGVNITMVLSLP
jgi:hypothetical protein